MARDFAPRVDRETGLRQRRGRGGRARRAARPQRERDLGVEGKSRAELVAEVPAAAADHAQGSVCDAELLHERDHHRQRRRKLRGRAAERDLDRDRPAPLVEHRRRVVGDKVRMTNRLTRTLKNYFPQVLQWFQDKDTHIFCDFLSRWPTLKAAQLARRSTLETFFRDHHVHTADVLATRLHAIKAATPLTTDEGIIAPNVLLVQTLVSQWRVTLDAIEAFDQAIAQRALHHPDFPLFQALPGAGPVCASRLLVAFGEQRERYASAAALQK